MSSDRVHLGVAEARALGERALSGIGYDEEEARIIADHVIDAALCGYEYSGLAKILNIPEHGRFPLPRRPMRILHETEVSALYDGGNTIGMVAMYHAANAAIAKAATHGRAPSCRLAGIRGSGSASSSRRSGSSAARRSSRVMMTAMCSSPSGPICWCRSLSFAASSARWPAEPASAWLI